MKKLQAKRFLLYFLFLSSLLSVLGCSDEDYGHSVPAGSRELTLFYQQQADVEVITRTNTLILDEIKINNLYSIFYKYDDTDENNRTFAGVSVNELNSNNDNGTVTIQLPDGLLSSGKFYVYFLANPEGYVDLNGYANVKLWLEAVLSGITYTKAADLVEGIAPDSPITTGPGLPMFGKATKEISDANTIVAILTRTVSRIDLYIDQTKLPHEDFELEAVTIRNARGYTKLLSGSSVGLFNDDSFKQYKGETNAFTPKTEDGVDQIVGEMYTFPNYQAATSKGDKVTTCLIIKGKYNGGESSFYRLNVKPTTGSQVLKPNHIYRIKIMGVTGAGAKDEDGAYQESDGKLSYEIDDWKSGDMGDGASDVNGNKLNVSPRQVVFSYQKNQTASVNILKTLKDGVNGPDGDVTVTSSDTDHFEATLNANGIEFEIKVLTDNYGNTDREAHVMVEWGTMKVPVYITQLGATSTSGGMRVAPNELRFGSIAQEETVKLIVSGDLSGVNASLINAQVFNTDNSIDEEWCRIQDGFSETSSGVFEFKIAVDALAASSVLSRSAVAYFTLKKGNGEVLNAIMSVRQYVGGNVGGGSGEQVALELFYYGTNNPPVNQALTNESGYTRTGDLWGFGTSVIEGLPEEFESYQGSRHLHFSITGNRFFKYRLFIDSNKDWRIVLKDEAVGAIELSATTSVEAAGSKYVYIAAANDVEKPWTGGSIVIEFSDGTEEVFYVHQSGVFSYLKYSADATSNDKIYYYGTITVWGVTMLDRNLGATDNGYYSNIGTSSEDVKNKGTYFKTADEAQADCPPGWRLPKGGPNSNEEFGLLFNKAQWGTVVVNGLTYDNVWSVQLNSDTPPEYWLIPLCGSSEYPTRAYYGNYWHEGGAVYFSYPGSKGWIPNPSDGYSARCVRD